MLFHKNILKGKKKNFIEIIELGNMLNIPSELNR